MRWWCSAQGGAWTWTWGPYIGVWLMLAALAFGYWRLRRSTPRDPGDPAAGRRGTVRFALGMLALWAALDWPLAALGAGYLAAAHMVQYLVLSLVAPPLLLRAVPAAAYARLRTHARTFAVLERATRPGIAVAIFSVVLVGSHLSQVLDGMMASQIGSFALDATWLAAGAVFWWPLVCPVPERPGFHTLLRMGYLLATSVPGTAVGMFLVLSEYPQYSTYELAPRVAGLGLDVITDQRLAGLLMKFGAGVVLWIVITALFFRWYRESEEEDRAEAGAVAAEPAASEAAAPDPVVELEAGRRGPA